MIYFHKLIAKTYLFLNAYFILNFVLSYFMSASVVGIYSLPLLRHLKPKRQDTPMTKLIGNCAVVLIMSSALPVLSRTLGKS